MLDRVESALLEGILQHKPGWITAAIFLLKNKRKDIYNDSYIPNNNEEIKIIIEKQNNNTNNELSNITETNNNNYSVDNIDWGNIKYETS